jgi:uncharacterized membrane protein YkoI
MIIKKQFMVWGLVAGLIAPAFAEEKDNDHEDEGQKVALASTPTAVQATIAAHLAKGTILAVEQETEAAVTAYEAKIKLPDGKELELLVAADGKLLKSKIEADDEEEDDDHEEHHKK